MDREKQLDSGKAISYHPEKENGAETRGQMLESLAVLGTYYVLSGRVSCLYSTIVSLANGQFRSSSRFALHLS